MDRVIFHCDLNCFYASVELLSHPELREVPVAVAGDPASRHGIILAKNEPAKQCGVKTAETIWQAKKKCPNLVLLPAHHKLYREYSNKVNAIYDEYTDLAESFGIDESWLDVTNTLHLFGGDAVALADGLRDRLRRELGLTISVGVSFNKVFAKLGSDYKKPDATTVITRENFRQIVWPLPVSDLLYVGRAAAETFQRFGVKTIGDLAAFDRQALFTGDILSTGFWAAQLGEIREGDTVAVLGAGPTGLCTMMCARLYRPACIITVEPDPARRALALSRGWADLALEPGEEALERVRALTGGRGADVVIEAAGGPDTFQTAWQAARPSGIVVVAAMYEESQSLPLPEMYGKNLTFKTGGVDACRCGEILGLIAAGQLDTEPLITHTYPLADVMEAYRLFEAKEDGVLKVVVRP